ncbi:MAG TPA: L,D-transpeptidase family protein [Steroidobacteraceae bacterium]|jgi:murein L,D-transpeptidase YafK
MKFALRLSLLLTACLGLASLASADGIDTSTTPGTGNASAELRSGSSMPLADRVVVKKGERKLLLMHGDSILRTYKVALGLNPVGHKERAGDFRTPEGRYRLTRRNPRSDFFLSIQVSYPNDDDVRKARRNGWDTGGSIMIHGLPNQLKHTPAYYENRDWTDGCIALSNADMLEIWLLTADNAPIDILP